MTSGKSFSYLCPPSSSPTHCKLIFESHIGTRLAVPWLRLCASTAGAMGLIPGQGATIPHVKWHGPTIKKEKRSKPHIAPSSKTFRGSPPPIIVCVCARVCVHMCVCSCVCARVCVLSCSVLSDSLQPPGLSPTNFLSSWDSLSKNTGVGCHFLPQGYSRLRDRTCIS